MREIKFRFWDSRNKCFVSESRNIDMFILADGTIGFHREQILSGNIDSVYNVDQFTSEQYTGLKDKNGVEIYEGDIARILYTDWASQSDYSISLDEYKKSISNNGFIEYYKHGYFVNFGLDRFEEICRGMIDPGKHGEIEIIGNIHQNPELLK